MPYSTPQQLRFPPIAGYIIRADFEGGALSSDFGTLLLRGIDRQIGLTERPAAALQDKRHQSYIEQNPQSSSQNSQPSRQRERSFLGRGSKSCRLKFARCCYRSPSPDSLGPAYLPNCFGICGWQ